MDPLDGALDLMRRLPPPSLAENLSKVLALVPELTDDLLASVDQPSVSQVCSTSGKPFLLCDYNRDGSAYRSPWTNEYEPTLEDGTKPSAKLRELEVLANDAFAIYRDLYFDGGMSSVYFWDLDEGFAAAVLLKKVSEEHGGSWNSIHVLQITPDGSGKPMAHYQLTSTILLEVVTGSKKLGTLNLSGSLTRQAEQDFAVDQPVDHVPNMGRLIEDMESKMRNAIQDIYFGKTKDIVNEIRSVGDLVEARKQAAIKDELAAKLSARRKV